MNGLFRLRGIGVILSLLILLGLFEVLSTRFLTLSTFSSILAASSELGIVALGVTLLMIAGEFDLSVGANFAFSGMFFSVLTTHVAMNGVAALILSLGVAAGIGFLNGMITALTRIPSFITTLGTMMFWRGMVLLATSGIPISCLSRTRLMEALSPEGTVGFLPGTLLWLLVAASVGFVIRRTPFGNHVMATGGGQDAAYSMGVHTTRVKWVCFSLCGLFAGLGGILQFCHMGSFLPAAGEGYELSAIAATVIGGTLLTGGVGTIVGTVCGALMINVIGCGIVQAGASTYWYQSFVGVIVILAVTVNVALGRKWSPSRGGHRGKG